MRPKGPQVWEREVWELGIGGQRGRDHGEIGARVRELERAGGASPPPGMQDAGLPLGKGDGEAGEARGGG